MIERLVYRSHAVGILPQVALEKIFESSAPNNRRLEITGALGFSKLTYVQLLEGPPPAIETLLEALRSDPRHTELQILLQARSHRRLLPGWAMARVDLAKMAPEVQAALSADDGLGLMALMATLAHEGIAA